MCWFWRAGARPARGSRDPQGSAERMNDERPGTFRPLSRDDTNLGLAQDALTPARQQPLAYRNSSNPTRPRNTGKRQRNSGLAHLRHRPRQPKRLKPRSVSNSFRKCTDSRKPGERLALVRDIAAREARDRNSTITTIFRAAAHVDVLTAGPVEPLFRTTMAKRVGWNVEPSLWQVRTPAAASGGRVSIMVPR
jgi:hypothetical protein